MTDQQWREIKAMIRKPRIAPSVELVSIAVALWVFLIIVVLSLDSVSRQHALLEAVATSISHIGTPAQFATAIVTVLAFLLGFHQWREQRRENAMDKWYARLESGNRLLVENSEARRMIRGQISKEYHPEKEKAFIWVYSELDNLEYGLHKFKIGYLSAAQFRVVVWSFWKRCESKDFRTAVRLLSNGYASDVQVLVEQVCARMAGALEDS